MYVYLVDKLELPKTYFIATSFVDKQGGGTRPYRGMIFIEPENRDNTIGTRVRVEKIDEDKKEITFVCGYEKEDMSNTIDLLDIGPEQGFAGIYPNIEILPKGVYYGGR